MIEQVIYFSDLFPKKCPKTYRGLVEVLDRYEVEHRLLKGTRDIWCRDYMPIEVYPGHFVAWGYNPDYLQTEKLRQTITDGKMVAERNLGIDICDRQYILVDGGNVVRDYGKMIMTSKVFEENPHIPVEHLARDLKDTMGAHLTVIPRDRFECYGHADGMVRILNENTVLMTNYSQIDPDLATRIRRRLEPSFKNIRELHYNVERPSKHNWAYINWLKTDKVLILPKFNIPEDEQALKQVKRLIPKYKDRIEMVDATDLIGFGGCLNCISWDVYTFVNSDNI